MSLVLRVSSSITEAQVGKMKKKRLEEENREDKERKKSEKYVTHRKVSMKYIYIYQQNSQETWSGPHRRCSW